MPRNLLLLLVSSSLFVACEKFTLPEAPTELVVVSSFSADRNVRVFVSETRGILDNDGAITNYVTNAIVKLYEGDIYKQTLQLQEPKVEENEVPYYSSSLFTPRPNVLYTIRVSAPGHEEVTATSSVPVQIELQATQVQNVEQVLLEGGGSRFNFDLRIDFTDPGSEVNFYHIQLTQEYEQYALFEADTVFLATYNRTIKLSSSDDSNNQIAHVNGGLLLNDEPFDGKIISYTVPVSIELGPLEQLGQLFIDLRSVSEEYYRYFESLSKQQGHTSDSPFEDPIFLFDNVEGGKGVFAGYNSSHDTVSIQN